MNIHKTIVAYLATLMLITGTVSGVAGEPIRNPSDEKLSIIIEGTTVKYVGKVSEKNVEMFMNMVKGRNLAKLVINSGGGEINAGMEIGSWVFDNQIDVVVDGVCMSSCANYIFTAGRYKTISKGSIVAWHGNALQESGISEKDVRESINEAFNRFPESEKKKRNIEDLIKKSTEQMREYRATSIQRQAAFFAKISVDEYVCRIGSEKYGAQDFYFISVEDMDRFGIHNVRAPENYEKTNLTPFCNKGKKIEYIKLRD